MASQFHSKHGIVSRGREELYMAFTDMRHFVSMLPEDRKKDVRADSDSISFTAKGLTIGVRIVSREPYSYIGLKDDGAPLSFSVGLHFDSTEVPYRTDFHIEAEAELNIMMKAMIGGRIKEVLDKIVDGLVAVSEGRKPEGVDFPEGGFGF